LDLTPEPGYAFKVAPVNAVGDGILSSASIVSVARAGVSASKTTATGALLGVLQGLSKKNILLHLCLMTVPRLLRGATVLGVGNIHVLRKEATSPAGHSG